MLLDWNNPPLLAAPRRKMVRALNDDRIKLLRLKDHRAKGAKNHATNKERSMIARTKSAAATKAVKERYAAVEAFKSQVRAYWRGELDSFPTS